MDELMENYVEHEMSMSAHFWGKTISLHLHFHSEVPWGENVQSDFSGGILSVVGKFVCG
jgi:hypothetical protein